MKVLFVTPTFDRGGSELVLATLLRHMDRTKRQPAVFCDGEGHLAGTLPPEISVFAFRPTFESWWTPRWRHVRAKLRGLTPMQHALWELHRRIEPDLWYLNTLECREAVPLARRLGVPYVLHAYEMPYIVYDRAPADSFSPMIEGALLLIACSESVAHPLRQLSSHPIEVLHPFLTVPEAPPRSRTSAIRRDLGISDNDFVWAMTGTIEYRKGADYFIDLAAHFQGAPVQLLWLGHGWDTAYDRLVEREIERRDLRNVRFLGEQGASYLDNLSCADGFVLTSREDSFPLAMIEAAALGKPIVSFDSGGVSEFLRDEMGSVVDSWNVSDLAATMKAVMDGSLPTDPAVSVARAREFDVGVQLPRWEELMDGVGNPSETTDG